MLKLLILNNGEMVNNNWTNANIGSSLIASQVTRTEFHTCVKPIWSQVTELNKQMFKDIYRQGCYSIRSFNKLSAWTTEFFRCPGVRAVYQHKCKIQRRLNLPVWVISVEPVFETANECCTLHLHWQTAASGKLCTASAAGLCNMFKIGILRVILENSLDNGCIFCQICSVTVTHTFVL